MANWRMGIWGIAAAGVAIGAAVCAVVVCAAAKLLKRDLRDRIIGDVEVWMRREHS